MQLLASQQSPAALIAAARRRIKQRALVVLKPLGVSPQQCGILLVIAEDEGLCLHDVAERMFLDDPTTGRVVQRLAGKRLVVAVDDPSDRRRFRLHLTPGGKRLTKKLQSAISEVRETVEQGLSAAEKSALLKTLRKVIDNLDPQRSRK